ncbi:MAG: phosphotransferase [Xanthomonadales bacterium]|nr:phosphotransferase [Xanthomonadales bacterium]
MNLRKYSSNLVLPTYPGLSKSQQQQLPELIRATALPAMFSDSTHQLWDCETLDGSLIVKICQQENITHSAFWQAMESLFGVNLPAQLGGFAAVYKTLSAFSPLVIPEYIASGFASKNEQAFIATKKVPGTLPTPATIKPAVVASLAEHIAGLHRQSITRWGQIEQPQFTPQQWPQRLRDSLRILAGHHGDIPATVLAEALKSVEFCGAKEFVPIMPDLRWDQFLLLNGKLSALVDLDAFVFAPRELELVLLEYLLDEQQAQTFIQRYQQTLAMPDLSAVRKPYRLLLFLMNVLAEKNLKCWMHAPSRFFQYPSGGGEFLPERI